jgi:hypothetical protein
MSDPNADNRQLPIKPAKPVKRRVDDDEDDLKPDDLKSGGPGLMVKIVLVLLTLALLIPSALSRNPFSHGVGRGVQVGTVGKDARAVFSADNEEATEIWQEMGNIVFELPRGGYMPLTSMLADGEVSQFVQEHPSDGFWLLREYAASMVPAPTDERVRRTLNGDEPLYPELAGIKPMVRTRAGILPASPDMPGVYAAMRDFLLVRYALQAETDLGKPSLTMIENANTRMFREVKGRVVEVASRDFLSQVPTTFTDDEIKAQLLKYADVDRKSPPSVNSPLGFGYRYNNRAKVQAIIVRFAQLRETVKSQVLKTGPRAWELAAARYYKDNPDAFRVEIESTTQPTTTTAPTTGPTTRATRLPEFDEVRQKAIELAIDAETRRRLVGPRDRGDAHPPVLERMQQILRDDFKTWTAAGSKPDDALMSEAHLAKIAETLQKQYDFLPATLSLQGRFYSADDLDAHDVLGKFVRPTAQRTRRSIDTPVGQFVLQYIRPFVPARLQTRLGDGVLDIGEPTDPLYSTFGIENANDEFNPRGDIAVLRVIAVDGARAATLDDLKADPLLQAKVMEDLRNDRAMALARQEAESIRRAAIGNGNRLDGVSGGRPVLPEQTLSAVERSFQMSPSGFPNMVTIASRLWGPDFAAKLLVPNPDRLAVVDKPGAMQVCVIEVLGTELVGKTDSGSLAMQRVETAVSLSSNIANGTLGLLFPAAQAIESRATEAPLNQLFTIDELRARLQFKPAKK